MQLLIQGLANYTKCNPSELKSHISWLRMQANGKHWPWLNSQDKKIGITVYNLIRLLYLPKFATNSYRWRENDRKNSKWIFLQSLTRYNSTENLPRQTNFFFFENETNKNVFSKLFMFLLIYLLIYMSTMTCVANDMQYSTAELSQ